MSLSDVLLFCFYLCPKLCEFLLDPVSYTHLYRASAYGNINLMYPMITSEDELDEIEKLIREVKKGLDEKKDVYKRQSQCYGQYRFRPESEKGR